MASEIDAMRTNISSDVIAERDELIALRRQIHRFPELGFNEHKTKALVLERLARYGIAATEMGKTGVVALIEGQQKGPVLLLRGDMDALPIDEQCEVPWKSEVKGAMHACGHDAHTAMMLIAAKILKKRGIARGAVKIMFQPAEEGGGGAQVMVDSGVLHHPDVDCAVGFHVWSGFDIGTVAVLEGPVTASVDGFRIIVRGKGCHAATPESGIDPVSVAAQIVTSAQALVTRRIRAEDPVVLSFTSIAAGSAFNIIPETAEILGTFRTFDESVRARLKSDLIRLSRNIADSFDARVEYDTFTETRSMSSDSSVVAMARKAVESTLGKEGIIYPKPLMVGEDFADITAKVPGAFVMLGCKNEEVGAVYPHHHPLFTIDEEVLPIGVEIALQTADLFLR
jgi:amidohydrolase